VRVAVRDDGPGLDPAIGDKAFDPGIRGSAKSGGGGGLGGLLGGLAGAIGGNAALISSIVGGFGKLGLKPEDARKFVPVILGFLRTKVGPDVVSSLEKTLRA